MTGSLCAPSSDELSVEEPLEIRLSEHAVDTQPTSVAVTMRTPGDDVDLTAGFLFTEGIISGVEDIEDIRRAGVNAAEARLRPGTMPGHGQAGPSLVRVLELRCLRETVNRRDPRGDSASDRAGDTPPLAGGHSRPAAGARAGQSSICTDWRHSRLWISSM